MKAKHYLIIATALTAIIFVAANLLVQKVFTGARIDFTENNLYTLSDATKSTLKTVAEPVDLTFVYTRSAGQDFPAIRAYAARVRELLQVYESQSGGNVRVTEIDPLPFSPAEDQALAAGITAIDTNGSDPLYFGIIGRNSIDDQRVIPFLAPEREVTLEYDLTRMVARLDDPDPPRVGILSSLPGMTAPGGEGGYTLLRDIHKSFDVEPIAETFQSLPEDLDVLLIAQPPLLSPRQEWLIDQFILRTGRAVILVDPAAKTVASTGPFNMSDAATSSSLMAWGDAWGVELSTSAVADAASALPVPVDTGGGRIEELAHPLFLGIPAGDMNQDDLITADLSRAVNFGAPGAFSTEDLAATLEMTPLLSTGPSPSFIDASDAITDMAPQQVLRQYQTEPAPLVLAARLSGRLSTAFPQGAPAFDEPSDPMLAEIARTDRRCRQWRAGPECVGRTGWEWRTLTPPVACAQPAPHGANRPYAGKCRSDLFPPAISSAGQSPDGAGAIGRVAGHRCNGWIFLWRPRGRSDRSRAYGTFGPPPEDRRVARPIAGNRAQLPARHRPSRRHAQSHQYLGRPISGLFDRTIRLVSPEAESDSMSDVRSKQRIRRLQIMGGIAIGLTALTFTAHSLHGPSARSSERDGQRVIPDFAAIRADASEIRVTLSDEAYTLANTQDGWKMGGPDGYPIRPDRLAELATGLEGLSWGEGRTRDPDKLNRIGLGDPRDGGTGALVEILDEDGKITAALITGRKDSRVYGRLPSEEQAFQVNGDLPPLYSHDAWLDFDILDINSDAISAVRLFDSMGESLYLQRSVGSSDRSFVPGPPFQDFRLVSRLAASTPALALTRFAPIGVKPASKLQTRTVARHITETHDGLEVELRAFREPDGYFVTLRAIEAGEGAHRGSTINDKAEGWAYQLAEYDWNEFTPRVSSIVRAPVMAIETGQPAQP